MEIVLTEVGFGRAVSRFLSASLRTERIICLSSQYPKPVCLRNTGAGRPKWFPIWPCTRWGFPCRVACASRGALLPHLFTLTPGLRRWRYNFLWHFPLKSFPTFPPRVSPVEPELRGIAPGGVRTFLPRLAPEAILRPSKTVANIKKGPSLTSPQTNQKDLKHLQARNSPFFQNLISNRNVIANRLNWTMSAKHCCDRRIKANITDI